MKKYTFKENLKLLREERGLTLVDLSEIVGLSRSSISNWERGLQEPSLSAAVKLADFFNVSLDFLAGRKDI